MMKKRTRRILALIVIVTLSLNLEILIKAMVVIPAVQLLLFQWDEFEKENRQIERGYKYE